MTEQAQKPTTFAEYYANKPAVQPAKETPDFIKQMDAQLLKRYNPKRYKQQVWQQLNPGQELPEELK